jgi:hypothetical protein
MVELVRARRAPDEPAAEFEPTAQSILNKAAEGRLRLPRLIGAKASARTASPPRREEPVRLRRENRRLLGHAIDSRGSESNSATMRSGRSCQKPRLGSLGRPTRRPLRVRERQPGRPPRGFPVPGQTPYWPPRSAASTVSMLDVSPRSPYAVTEVATTPGVTEGLRHTSWLTRSSQSTSVNATRAPGVPTALSWSVPICAMTASTGATSA